MNMQLPISVDRNTDPASVAAMASHRPLARVLGLGTAMSLVIGNVIGSGIFVKPGVIAQQLDDFGSIVLVWVVGGVVCVLGGLCFAELASLMPGAGGLYVYLRHAYGPLVGFLFGWNEVLFNKPASTGALAVVLADSFARILGRDLGNLGTSLCAIFAVFSLAFINGLGVRWGGLVQRWTTGIKVLFLAAIGLFPFLMTVLGWNVIRWDHFLSTTQSSHADPWISRFGIALLSVMWAYNGWHNVTPVAEEIRKPRRNVARAILGGIGIIAALYLLANVAYHGVSTIDQVAASGDHAAEDMLRRLWGPTGASLMSLVILCSVFGTINSDLLIVPRVTFAMDRDGLAPKRFANVHHTFRTPTLAIAAHAALTSMMILGAAGSIEVIPGLAHRSAFDLLTNFVVFTASVFYVLAVVSVFVLRSRRLHSRPTFRTWGYPWTPLIFLFVYTWFLSVVFWNRPFEASVGVVLMFLGLPAYMATRSRYLASP
jgi:APA family basic amino acid/polyamine antiporter